MMRNGDREERIFLSHPHTNNRLFFFTLIVAWAFVLNTDTYENGYMTCVVLFVNPSLHNNAF